MFLLKQSFTKILNKINYLIFGAGYNDYKPKLDFDDDNENDLKVEKAKGNKVDLYK